MANTENINNGKNGVTWKWLVGVLVGVLILVGGGVVAGMQSDIKMLRAEKLDKDQYYRDVGEMKDAMKSMNEKLDRLIQRRQ